MGTRSVLCDVTAIDPPGPEGAYLRGIRGCVTLLEETRDADEFHVAGIGGERVGKPQNNAVYRALRDVVARGNEHELEGFCAVLTEICAIADHGGDYTRIFRKYASRRTRVMRRRAVPVLQRRARLEGA